MSSVPWTFARLRAFKNAARASNGSPVPFSSTPHPSGNFFSRHFTTSPSASASALTSGAAVVTSASQRKSVVNRTLTTTTTALNNVSECPKSSESETLWPRQEVKVSRLMSPEDANIRGYVHGGHLIRLMEEAGFVAATKQVAIGGRGGGGGGGGSKLGALVRMERLDFLEPVEVGDLVQVEGGVDFASPRSCRVSLRVTAAAVVRSGSKGPEKRLTNTVRLWYVPLFVGRDGGAEIIEMPSVDLSDVDPSDLAAANLDHETLKRKRNYFRSAQETTTIEAADLLYAETGTSKLEQPGTVAWTRSSTSKLVTLEDCDVVGNVSGGCLLKMADEVAALAASKHTMGGTPTTACMDAVDFKKIIPKGSFVRLTSHVTFAGGKSCEVLVKGDAVEVYASGGPRPIPDTMEARFTFVAFDRDGFKLKEMPELIPSTEEEKKEFEKGKERYEARKKTRAR